MDTIVQTFLMLMKQACFFKALPDKSFVLKKEEWKGGKRSKERFTVLLCSNWNGSEKLKPLVIGKTFSY